jgi:hypothetical protein
MIKGEALVVRRQGIHLRRPSRSLHAYALNENRGWSSAVNIIGELATFVKE